MQIQMMEVVSMNLCEFNQVYLYCSPGGWPEEVSWYIEDSLGNQIIDGVVRSILFYLRTYRSYKVVGEDTYGDGWNSAVFHCCRYSDNVLFKLDV